MVLRFGLWTTDDESGKYRLCRCDCGTVRSIPASNLRRGLSGSCGCRKLEARVKAAAAVNTRHGMVKSPEYRTWVEMRRRCNDSRRHDYGRYGGRGIKVSPEWEADFVNFYRDMGPRPDGMTLERKDNLGNYEKDNCVWASKSAQARNRSSSHLIEVDGRLVSAVEAAELKGIPYRAFKQRIRSPLWTVERALNTPYRPSAPRGSRKLRDGGDLVGEHDPAGRG